MPTRHDQVTVLPGGPVAITNGSATAARVDNPTGYDVILQATTTSTPPANANGGLTLPARSTLAADLTLEQLFPGVGTGALFLWGFATNAVTLSVSHA